MISLKLETRLQDALQNGCCQCERIRAKIRLDFRCYWGGEKDESNSGYVLRAIFIDFLLVVFKGRKLALIFSEQKVDDRLWK